MEALEKGLALLREAAGLLDGNLAASRAHPRERLARLRLALLLRDPPQGIELEGLPGARRQTLRLLCGLPLLPADEDTGGAPPEHPLSPERGPAEENAGRQAAVKAKRGQFFLQQALKKLRKEPSTEAAISLGQLLYRLGEADARQVLAQEAQTDPLSRLYLADLTWLDGDELAARELYEELAEQQTGELQRAAKLFAWFDSEDVRRRHSLLVRSRAEELLQAESMPVQPRARQAAELAEQAIALSDDDPSAWRFLGECQLQAGLAAEALDSFAECEAQGGAGPGLSVLIARTQRIAGQSQRAQATLEMSHLVDGQALELDAELAGVRAAGGDLRGALELLEPHVQRLEEEGPRRWNQDRIDALKRAVDGLAVGYAERPETRLLEGRVLFALGELEAATVALEAAAAPSPEHEAALLLARVQLARNAYTPALEALKLAESKQSQDAAVFILRADIFDTMGLLEPTREALLRAVALGDEQAEQRLAALQERAEADAQQAHELLTAAEQEREPSQREARQQEAVACLRRAAQAEPAAEHRRALSDGLLAAGEAGEALKLLLQDVGEQDDPGPSLLAIGDARLALGEQEMARGAWRSALALQPDCAPAHLRLGRLYLERRELEPALRHLRAATAEEPVPEGAWQAHAIAALEAGDFAGCQQLAERLDPELTQAARDYLAQIAGRRAARAAEEEAARRAAAEPTSAEDPEANPEAAAPTAASEVPADSADEPPAAPEDQPPHAEEAGPAAEPEITAEPQAEEETSAAAAPPDSSAEPPEEEEASLPVRSETEKLLGAHLWLACAAARGALGLYAALLRALQKRTRGVPLAVFFHKRAPRDLAAIVACWYRLCPVFLELDRLLGPCVSRSADELEIWQRLDPLLPEHGISYDFDGSDRYERVEDPSTGPLRAEKTHLAAFFCETALFYGRWQADAWQAPRDPDWPPRTALLASPQRLPRQTVAMLKLLELHEAAGRAQPALQLGLRSLIFVEGRPRALVFYKLAALAGTCGRVEVQQTYLRRAASIDSNVLATRNHDDRYREDRERRAELLRGQARLALAAQDIERSADFAARARYVDPDSAEGHALCADLELRQGKWIEAERSCEYALSLQPDHAAALELAQTLLLEPQLSALADAWFARAEQFVERPGRCLPAIDHSLRLQDLPARRLWKARRLQELGRDPLPELRTLKPAELDLEQRQEFFLCLVHSLQRAQEAGALQAAASMLPAWVEPWRLLGDAQAADGAFEHALESYQQGLQRAPEDRFLTFACARCLARLQRPEEALKTALQALALPCGEAPADSQAAQQDNLQQLAGLGQLLGEPEALVLARAHSLEALGELNQALQALDALEPTATSCAQAARICRRHGQLEPALDRLQHAVRQFPLDTSLLLETAELHVARGQPDQAFACLRDSGLHEPEVTAAQAALLSAARERVRDALLEVETCSLEQAALIAPRALQDARIVAESHAWELLGEARLRLADIEAAGTAFSRARELDPGSARALYGLARVAVAREASDALELYTLAARLAGSAERWQELADLAYRHADWQRLSEAFDQLGLHEPRQLSWSIGHAVATCLAGSAEQAERQLQSYAGLDHDGALAWLAVRTLRGQEPSPALEALAARAPRDPLLEASARRADFVPHALAYVLLVCTPSFRAHAAGDAQRLLRGFEAPRRERLLHFWRGLSWRAPFAGVQYTFQDGRYAPNEDEEHHRVRQRKQSLGRLAWRLGHAQAQKPDGPRVLGILEVLDEQGAGLALFQLAEQVRLADAPALASELYGEAFAEMPPGEEWRARLGQAFCFQKLGSETRAAEAALAVLRKKAQQQDARALLKALGRACPE